MYFIKSFFSHLLAIILFVVLFLLAGIFTIKELFSRDNVYVAVEKTPIVEEGIDEFKKEESVGESEIIDEVWEYIEIDDIFNNYLTDRLLYGFKLIDEEPKIDLDELNKRIATGIEEYIDVKIDEYTGGMNSLLEESGFDLGLKEKIKDYINDNTSIALSNEEIITEKDLEELYDEMDKNFLELEESTPELYQLIEIIYNDKLPIILLIVIIIIFGLIALINFNALTAVAYTIAPFAINSIIYLIGYIGMKNLNFDGGIETNAINYLKNQFGLISFKYFIIYILCTVVAGLLYYVGKHLNILISHKTGKATLDTVFDDYDRDGVVKQLQEKDNNKDELEGKE